MMFVGDKGKILAGFRGERPQILGQPVKNQPEAAPRERSQQRNEGVALWVAAAKGGKPTFGDFLLGGPISDAFTLGAVSLRLGGKRLVFDAASAKVTNAPEANKFLTREYRSGWELTGA
jgi:hypothetical protein